MTDIETNRQVNKFKKATIESLRNSRHFSSKFTYGTCIITKIKADISLWKRKILIWSKFYIKLKYIKLLNSINVT